MLPGITIGDCGPKNGVNGIDNGFIMLDDVKIPYENLLNKFGWIDEMGVYCSKVADKNKRFGVHMSGFSSGRGLISFKVNSRAFRLSNFLYVHPSASNSIIIS